MNNEKIFDSPEPIFETSPDQFEDIGAALTRLRPSFPINLGIYNILSIYALETSNAYLYLYFQNRWVRVYNRSDGRQNSSGNTILGQVPLPSSVPNGWNRKQPDAYTRYPTQTGASGSNLYVLANFDRSINGVTNYIRTLEAI